MTISSETLVKAFKDASNDKYGKQDFYYVMFNPEAERYYSAVSKSMEVKTRGRATTFGCVPESLVNRGYEAVKIRSRVRK